MKKLITTLSVALALAVSVNAQAFNYFTDFESYTLGSVLGQDGWEDSSMGSAIDLFPYASVIADPTSSGHGNVLSIYFAGDNYWIGAYRPFGDLIAQGYTQISLSWDQYRPAFDGAVTFSQDTDFMGWWGFQDAETLYINYFDSPTAELTAGVWQNIRIDFNVTDVDEFGVSGTAEGFLNNVSFGTSSYVVLDTFKGVNFQIAANFGEQTAPIYLDNISVAAVPEPSSLAAMLTGMVGIGWSFKRRRC